MHARELTRIQGGGDGVVPGHGGTVYRNVTHGKSRRYFTERKYANAECTLVTRQRAVQYLPS